ncbi:MAG: hypothetical protein IKZ64_00720 [Alphaproteobacteria bacterium]|nr:hypothetical protein [Alphaproteobacteria bacterium]
MKPFIKRFVDKVRARSQKKNAALPGARAKNLEELRKYAEELYAFVCNSVADITNMMDDAGLDRLIDDNENLIPEVDKYPELKKLYLERASKKKELEQILYAHPEMWKSIEDDACMYYDFDDIRQKITAIRDADGKYIEELAQKFKPLKDKFGLLNPNTLFRDKDAELETTIDEATANLMNEYFYLFYLYFDALATMGDKQDKVLWDAVPQVIKDNYVQFVNDKMVQILASDDRLTECVKNFDANETDPDAHERFIRLLEKRLNADVFDKADKPLSINLVLNKQKIGVGGECRSDTGTVDLNTAYWGGRNPSVDSIIGTIKHEVFGHYANTNFSSLGLYGKLMKDFMHDIQKCTHAGLTAAMDARVVEAVSPLLKQHYVIDMPSESISKKLQNQGWNLYSIIVQDDFDLYQNTFEERSAWLLTPTHDIIGQIDRYRASHGLTPIEKSR